jgi:hypothetical protein
MDNYFPADFHALRDLHVDDWRNVSNHRIASQTMPVDPASTVAPALCADRTALCDRSTNDCIDPGWQSL